MNILIPDKWLREHLETEASPSEIQEKLSLCGPSVERIIEKDGDKIYDIEITTNRADSLSVRGIAREAQTILSQFQIPAKFLPLKLKSITQSEKELPLPKIFSDDKLSRRISCVILANVKRTPTPDWMAQRLRQIDQNIHDSAVDITNYITHEIGHPCHAFDYEKIMELGGEIHVTTAKTGETFVTLDDEEYQAVGGEVVFRNQEGVIIDLPAVKGTKNTAVTDQTKHVLLWAESIVPEKVRLASMSHAIRTIAAQLAEKNVDPHLIEPTLKRGVELYQELCQAQVASQVYDDFKDSKSPQAVELDLAVITNYLGIEVSADQVANILEKLDCQVELVQNSKHNSEQATQLKITPPTFRPDLKIPADIVEEVARIYGYHNLPSRLMDTAIPTEKQKDVNFDVEQKAKDFLAHLGWQEVYTYSLVSESIAKQSGYKLENQLKLQNPLTDDRVYLRRSLLPSLEEVVSQNPQEDSLSVFEVANVYRPQKNDLPIEETQLGLLTVRSDWRWFMGMIEALLRQFFVYEVSVDEDKTRAPGFSHSATISAKPTNLADDGNEKNKSGDNDKHNNKVQLGTVGMTNTNHLAGWLRFIDLIKIARSNPVYQPIPKTTPIIEDLTFKLPTETKVGHLIKAVNNLSDLIDQVELKDVYGLNHTLTIFYLDRQENLTTSDIAPLRQKIAQTLEKDFGAELIGQI